MSNTLPTKQSKLPDSHKAIIGLLLLASLTTQIIMEFYTVGLIIITAISLIAITALYKSEKRSRLSKSLYGMGFVMLLLSLMSEKQSIETQQAVRNGDIAELTEMLRESDAKVREEAMHTAIVHGQLDAIDAILSLGIEPTKKLQYPPVSPLKLALQEEDASLIQVFKKHGVTDEQITQAQQELVQEEIEWKAELARRELDKRKVKFSGDLRDLQKGSYMLHDYHTGEAPFGLRFSNGFMIVSDKKHGSSPKQGRVSTFSSPNTNCIGFEQGDAIANLLDRRPNANHKTQYLICVAIEDIYEQGRAYTGEQYTTSIQEGEVFFMHHTYTGRQPATYYWVLKN